MVLISKEEILKDPNLVGNIIDEVHKNFYGEVDTIITLIISINTRLVKNCKAESKNIVLSSMSGSGKDWLVKTIARILLTPEITYFHRTKLSPEVFTYWKVNEEDWSWDGNVIHIEDPIPELMNSQGFKTMASGEKKATVIDKQKARELSVKGKPNMIITTYEGITNIEGTRRFPFIRLDVGDKLTDKVITKICNRYAGKEEPEVDSVLVEALQKLKPYEVVIPFAEELIDYIPSTLLMRTYMSRLLDYIASSCVLHQYQRYLTEDNKLIATWDDYEYGRLAFLKTITNDAMVSLSPQQQQLLDVIIGNETPMVVADIHKNIPMSLDWIYKNLEVLKGYKLIEQGSMYKQDANKDIRTYVGFSRFYSGFILPPTERSSGFIGIIGIMSKADEEEGKVGNNRLSYIYYNKTLKTIKPSEKCNNKTKENQIKPLYDRSEETKLVKHEMIEHPELEEFKKKMKGKIWNTEDKTEWVKLYARLYKEHNGRPPITYLN